LWIASKTSSGLFSDWLKTSTFWSFIVDIIHYSNAFGSNISTAARPALIWLCPSNSLFDPQTLRYVEANEAVARLLGAHGKDALRNISPAERWPERQPDGRRSIDKVRELIHTTPEFGIVRRTFLLRCLHG
jgi:hypothetical protein